MGTSAATPHAAEVAALLLEAEENPSMVKSGSILTNQKLLPAEVSDVLRSTAADLGAPGADNTFGSGRIDAFAAVQSVVQQPQPTPTPTPTPTDLHGNSNGGCTISGSAQAGIGFINILIPLLPAFVIRLRMIRRREKNTI